MKFIVSLTARAEQDRQRAFEWYAANYSVEFATRWFSGITHAMHSLPHMPERCHKAREDECFSFSLHELLYGKRMKHRVLFRIQASEVVVLHIRHSAQHDLAEGDL